MGVSPAQAVQALADAKDDILALQRAVEQAVFLDATPGEERQKLRAARKKLKDLQKAAAAKKAEEESAAAANRSPWAKETYDAAEFDALAKAYDDLKWRLISKPGGATVKPDEYYTLYGLHMQAASGDNTSERPTWAEKGGLDFDGRARWDAWTAVKGKSAADARLAFVKAFYEFSPQALYQDSRGDK